MIIRLVILGILLFPYVGEALELNRSELLKNCPIPEKRDFPVNSKVSPCEDFHKYVCSKVESNFKLPADRSSWSFSFTDNAERLLYAKKRYFKLLEKGYRPKTERAKQLENFYMACMNVGASKKEEIEVVKAEKNLVLSLKSHEELQNLTASRIDEAETSFVGFSKVGNQDDPNLYDVLLISEIMTLPERSYYDNPKILKDLEELVSLFFKSLNVKQARERARWVVAFEKEFAQKYPLPAELRERFSKNTYMKREEWLEKYPHLKLQRFLDRVPKNVLIRNLAPESVEFLNHALSSYPLEMLKSVYLFHSLTGRMDDAFPSYFKKKFQFNHKHLGGPLKRPERQERCTKLVMNYFPMELDEELIPILFPGFPQDQVIGLVSKIRESLASSIEENTWLSREAKKEALNKVNKAQLYLVKPQTEKQWDFNPVLTYSAQHPIKNKKSLNKALIEKSIQELAETRDRERWSMGPLTLNAYYSQADNKFVLLQGILQYPFFDAPMGEIQNLAAIGAVVGHELGHGIDDKGSKYDANGVLRQWMTDQDLQEFEKRGAKFVDRFNKIGHNGKLTLGENIGDHVGITSAYKAAFPNPEKASEADKKQFFISYARMWCQVTRPKMEQMILKTDPHALGFARINEQVIHLDGFYEAFACKKGHKLFVPPEERIKIW